MRLFLRGASGGWGCMEGLGWFRIFGKLCRIQYIVVRVRGDSIVGMVGEGPGDVCWVRGFVTYLICRRG